MTHKTRGSALITALFIMTMVAIATMAMSLRLQQNIYRTRLTLTTDKLYLASQAVTFWAMGVLAQPTSKTSTDHRQNMPSHENAFKFPITYAQNTPDVTTTGQLIDLQARFNLNQFIVDPSKKQNNQTEHAFLQLLNTVFHNKQSTLYRNIAQATAHWVNEVPTGQGQDEQTAYYLNQNPPYAASHQPMESVSEFRLIQGVDAAIYQDLLPYIIALPPPTAININTASLPVLMTLGPGLSEAEALSIIQARGEEGFSNLNQMNDLLKKLAIPLEQITLESNYFLCMASTHTFDNELFHYSILKRQKDSTGKITVTILHESLSASI